MSVKLRQQKNKNGISFYLDISIGGKRKREYLKGLNLFLTPKNPDERNKNAETKRIAESIRVKKESELKWESNGLDAPVNSEGKVLPYIERFRDNYKRKDVNKVIAMTSHFEDQFPDLTFKNLNENVVSDFKKYLEDNLKGETARSYYGKFKQAMKRAFIDKLCKYDIRTFEARFKIDKNNLKKEVLTPEEIQLIANTDCKNQTIKLGFIFCCFTGLDFADMFELRWSHVTESGLRKPREKTNIGRIIPLHETAKAILDKFSPKTDFVFQELPNRTNRTYSWQACNKTLGELIKRSGIKKHITWHSARHSFGTNTEGDEGTIAQLLGHSDTKMVKVYRRVKHERLRSAVDSLKGVTIV